MNAHTLRLLEFDTVRDQVASLTLGASGERLVSSSEVLTDRDLIDRRLDLVADWRAVIAGDERVPDTPLPDIEPLFAVLEKEGTVLDEEQLAAISVFIGAARVFANSGGDLEADSPLRGRLEALPDLDGVRRQVSVYISDTGEIKEDAIPELRRLRSRIRTTEGRIEKQAVAYLRDPNRAQYWTSDAPTQRNGRTVLPLSANYRNRVKGIVHEVSQTGATLFVEPSDLVDLNNELREVQAAYDQEIHRILRELTATVRADLSTLRTLETETAELDALLARARYGAQHDCFRAQNRAEGVSLTGARHPLLRESVVPIEIRIDPPGRGLIVTGPNTGGKTVALKTAGLLALMNQFGMEIPADDGSALPLFDDIFADIGDEQSLEQSLSTFSGHMTTIADVLQHAGRESLVLLDELGAGTDPEEGSALAMSILDEIARIGATAVVTTHHGALKNYAYGSDFFENASVEFDPQRLAPTFHVLIGVPGTSHALDIAERNGLPEGVVRRAAGYVEEGQGDEARIIRDLTEKQLEIHRVARARDAELSELKTRRAELEEQSQRVADRELTLRKEGLQEFERLSRETRRRLENLVREVREGELTREKTARVREFLDELTETAEKEQERVSAQEQERDRARAEVEARELAPGMEVAVGESGRRGVIRRKGKGDSWVVETETVRMELPSVQLRPTGSKSGGGHGERAGGSRGGGPRDSGLGPVSLSYESEHTPTPGLELDVRGYRLPEALSEVDRRIDDCLLSGVNQFSIIHGKGEGILQKGIRDHLASRDAVSSYDFARPEEGGYGKTIVLLRES
ncbi:MAG: endonuclease MutS2 [Spirochaetes bacterium]|jgi:DNA mismatch repair protein MutS2|nr:endonuclease MutS2 [Spirochaetota bacterium]